MKYFVTGGTGFIGRALIHKLADSGHTIHALFRSKSKTASLKHPHIQWFKGDVLDPKSILKAMNGCEYVFHSAAMTKIWSKNPQIYHQINVTGTKNIIESSLNLGIKKVVMTSTAGVFGPSSIEDVNETTIRKTKYFTEYERTKAEADSLALSYTQKGIDIVIVYPTRVYGPGPLKESNSVTKLMNFYIKGRWPLIPGNGKSIGNYVYIDDVVEGHISAMEKGFSGEKYILGGENISYREFFNLLRKVSQKNYFLLKTPQSLMRPAARIMTFLAEFTDLYPSLTPEMVKKLSLNWSVSSRKSVQDLGYRFLSLEEGLKKTLKWLESRKNDK